jgi:peptidoglycan/xylan/chitin deacetylase (PgdA/CDA1 family)
VARSRGRCVAALALALALSAAAPAAAAQTDPAGDATGPLDLISGDLAQQGSNLSFSVTTNANWAPSDLSATGPRSLCVRLFDKDASSPRESLCVQGAPKGRAAVLVPVDAAGAIGAPIVAAIHRANRRSLQARFAPAAVGLKAGDAFRWQIQSAWDGSGDQIPDKGAVDGSLAQPTAVGCKAAGASYRTNGPRGKKVVALTFDDGPGPLTPQFYSVLEREKVPGTFFLIGQQVGGKGALLKRALNDGFALGDHTWSHANVSGGGAAAARQVSSAKSAIVRTTGYTPCLFRAPYGAVSGSLIGLVRGQGMNTIQWDVDPTDWSTPGTGAIYSRIIAQTRPGSIILMHDGGGPRGQTLAALPQVIDTLKRKGYSFATVPDLLGLQPVYKSLVVSR